MNSLFVDTSENLVLGVLDKEFEWLDYKDTKDKKNSAIIHHEIYSLLEKRGFKAKEVESLFIINGPGSYTGVRVGEGLGQIFELSSVKTYSFYHHDIPKMMGVKKGVWISKAFKREYFFYSWDREEESTKLIAEALVKDEIKKLVDSEIPIHTHYLEHIDYLDCPIVETSRLVLDFAPVIFEHAQENKWRRPPYYYRTLENEFRVTLPDY